MTILHIPKTLDLNLSDVELVRLWAMRAGYGQRATMGRILGVHIQTISNAIKAANYGHSTPTVRRIANVLRNSQYSHSIQSLLEPHIYANDVEMLAGRVAELAGLPQDTVYRYIVENYPTIRNLFNDGKIYAFLKLRNVSENS
jgi:hypothetical protein